MLLRCKLHRFLEKASKKVGCVLDVSEMADKDVDGGWKMQAL